MLKSPARWPLRCARPERPRQTANITLTVPRSLLDLLVLVTAMLTEQRVIFFSASYALLCPIIEGVLAMLHPFKWQHNKFTLVPSHLLDLVDAPVPIVMGLHSRYAESTTSHGFSTGDPVVVDIDAGTVTSPASVVLPEVPSEARREFIAAAKRLKLDYSFASHDDPTVDPDNDAASRTAHNELLQDDIRGVFMDLMVSLFGEIRRHMLFEAVPAVFSPDLFLEQQPAQAHAFYSSVPSMPLLCCAWGGFFLFLAPSCCFRVGGVGRMLCPRTLSAAMLQRRCPHTGLIRCALQTQNSAVFSTSSFRQFQRSRHREQWDYFDVCAAERKSKENSRLKAASALKGKHTFSNSSFKSAGRVCAGRTISLPDLGMCRRPTVTPAPQSPGSLNRSAEAPPGSPAAWRK